MEHLKCILVDDEPLAIKMLEGFVIRTPFLELDASFTDPVLALSEIRERKPQIVFLDIQMPDLNGLELSKMISSDTRIIFTTAFKEYAFDSYEVSALDFLLKPIRYNKFLDATQKAKQWFEMREAAEIKESKTQKRNSIFIKVDGVLRKADFNDILYVEGMKDYVMFYLESEERPLVTYMRMKTVEDLLPSESFMRIHRSFIVNLDKISSIDSYNDVHIKDEIIHVTDAYKENFDRFLEKHVVRN